MIQKGYAVKLVNSDGDLTYLLPEGEQPGKPLSVRLGFLTAEAAGRAWGELLEAYYERYTVRNFPIVRGALVELSVIERPLIELGVAPRERLEKE